MPTSVLIVVALSVLLGILVIMLGSRDTDTSASGASDDVTGNAETVACRKHADLPQVRWNINRGSGAYLAMLDLLRNLAGTWPHGGDLPGVDTGANVDVNDDTGARSFADILISSGNHTPAVHAIVRLGDFHVVRFFSTDTPHKSVLNLVSDAPGKEEATDDNWFLGQEGYDALARVANQPLTAVNLSAFSLENSLRDLGVRSTDRTAQARGIVRYLIAITEASRSRNIAHRIANGMDNGSDVFFTAEQVGLMRH